MTDRQTDSVSEGGDRGATGQKENERMASVAFSSKQLFKIPEKFGGPTKFLSLLFLLTFLFSGQAEMALCALLLCAL